MGLRGLPSAAAILLIRFYQVALSPLKGGGCCRFHPTCSAYALTAFRRFGFWRGLGLTLWRLMRCHPFYRGCLYDPVPEKGGAPAGGASPAGSSSAGAPSGESGAGTGG